MGIDSEIGLAREDRFAVLTTPVVIERSGLPGGACVRPVVPSSSAESRSCQGFRGHAGIDTDPDSVAALGRMLVSRSVPSGAAPSADCDRSHPASADPADRATPSWCRAQCGLSVGGVLATSEGRAGRVRLHTCLCLNHSTCLRLSRYSVQLCQRCRGAHWRLRRARRYPCQH